MATHKARSDSTSSASVTSRCTDKEAKIDGQAARIGNGRCDGNGHFSLSFSPDISIRFHQK